MFSLLLFFFIIPFFTLFLIFTFMGILFIPIIFLLMSALAVLIFSGFFYWIFFALLVASAVYLITHIIDNFLKKKEHNKVFKFVFVIIIVIIAIGFMRRHFVYTEVHIINNTTGETQTWLENVIN
ncbi:hypothetical protein ACFX5K_03635 [Rickettsiales bacterium LUAb2]